MTWLWWETHWTNVWKQKKFTTKWKWSHCSVFLFLSLSRAPFKQLRAMLSLIFLCCCDSVCLYVCIFFNYDAYARLNHFLLFKKWNNASNENKTKIGYFEMVRMSQTYANTNTQNCMQWSWPPNRCGNEKLALAFDL